MTSAPSPIPDAQGNSGTSAHRGRLQYSDSLTRRKQTGETPCSKTSKPSHRPTNSVFRQIRSSQSTATTFRRPLPGDTSSHHPNESVSSIISQSVNFQPRRGSLVKEAMRKLFGKKPRGFSSDGGDLPTIQPYDFGPETPPESGRLVDRLDMTNITPKQLRPQPPSPASPLGSPGSSRSGRKLKSVTNLGEEQSLPETKQPPRRRVTLPSLYLSDPEARDLAKSLLASSPAVNEEEEDARRSFDRRNIHDRARSRMSEKRRSRSADALRELLLKDQNISQPIEWRATDEVKQWRKRLLGIESDAPAEITRESNSSDSIFVGGGENPSVEDAPEEGLEYKPPPEPVIPTQPSNPLVESLLTSMHDPDITLERRVTTLEVKSMDLELAIAKLQAVGRSMSRPSASFTDNRPFQLGSGDERRPSLPSVPPIPQALSTRERVYSNAAASLPSSRHMSTSTLRGEPSYTYPSIQTGGQFEGISVQQYSALVILLRREQTARKALEEQLGELRQELRDLRRSRGVPDSGIESPYPTPNSVTGRIYKMGSIKRTVPYEDDRRFTESETDTDSDFYSSQVNAYHRSNHELSQNSSISGMI